MSATYEDPLAKRGREQAEELRLSLGDAEYMSGLSPVRLKTRIENGSLRAKIAGDTITLSKDAWDRLIGCLYDVGRPRPLALSWEQFEQQTGLPKARALRRIRSGLLTAKASPRGIRLTDWALQSVKGLSVDIVIAPPPRPKREPKPGTIEKTADQLVHLGYDPQKLRRLIKRRKIKGTVRGQTFGLTQAQWDRIHSQIGASFSDAIRYESAKRDFESGMVAVQAA